MKNKYTELRALRNESDVEQHFISKLFRDLGFKDNNIFTKYSIPVYTTGKGSKKNLNVPDYLLKIGKIPTLICEAKHPDVNIKSYIKEAQEYADCVNRGFIGYNPIKYVFCSNGLKSYLNKVDENKPLLELNFEDFQNENLKFTQLISIISYSALKKGLNSDNSEEIFEFRTPDLGELKGIFKQAHDLIRRKQKIGPKKAFYEFTKLLFIKMNEDKEIQDKIDKGKTVTINDFNFSSYKIENNRHDWINYLFETYRNKLEEEVINRTKKRIFNKNEQLTLNPSTIKSIVEMIENFNLRSVEDDINGKVFETFLESAVRGKELGQFFTPRSVVKFMLKLADLKIRRNELGEYIPDKVLDGSCGTGGFLIFALSDLFKKIPVAATEVNRIKKMIREKSLYGIDASEDDIIPITRMNMYLHGDGGSHIFLGDTLDKEVLIEEGTSAERKSELEELRNTLSKIKFDVILTNPPFSMKYEAKKEDEKRILEQYEIARLDGKVITSLKSNLMFLERYYDILKPGGKLLTVIDESVLNTEGQGKYMIKFRKWLRHKYIVKAVISLPRNTFVNADTAVKTSVLYLTKRIDEEEVQPPIFMGISNDVGHTDTGRETSVMGDLEEIYNSYNSFLHG